MAVSAMAIPPLLSVLGPAGWPWTWGVLALLAAAAGLAAARAAPEAGSPASERRSGETAPLLRLAPILFGYFLIGAGGIGYLTFVFDWLSLEAGGWHLGMLFWITLGCAALAAPRLWRQMIEGTRGGRGFGGLALANAVGAGLPFLLPGLAGGLTSAVLFGATFFMITASTTAFVGRMPGRFERAGAIRAFTAAFALGQITGPMLVGAAADLAGGLRGPLAMAVVLIFLGAAIGFVQRDISG
jgi:hypothetical protein